MPALAFLHTSHVHIDTFGKLVGERSPDTTVHHEVDASLLDDALAVGSVPGWLERRVHKAMRRAAGGGARVVVCTCSTIGGAAESVETKGRFVAMRVDRPMAEAAAESGTKILVAAALEDTLVPTLALLGSLGKPLELTERVVPGAWRLFEAGDIGGYVTAIAEDVRIQSGGHDAVVLAQASMAPAASALSDIGTPVLSSPAPGVDAALQELED